MLFHIISFGPRKMENTLLYKNVTVALHGYKRVCYRTFLQCMNKNGNEMNRSEKCVSQNEAKLLFLSFSFDSKRKIGSKLKPYFSQNRGAPYLLEPLK